jgi:hypothetical protein
MIIAGGLVLLGVMLAIGTLLDRRAVAAKSFIPVWLAAAIVNMSVGVVSAGYTVWQELPIALVVFAVPALVAAVFGWRRPGR